MSTTRQRAWTDEPSHGRALSPATALRHTLLWASRRHQIRTVVVAAPVTRSLVRRFVAGESVEDAVRGTRELAAGGLHISLDHLGEDTRDATDAVAAVDAYRTLVQRLAEEGLSAQAEVSVKLSALGQAIDESLALDNARRICAAARDAGTTVTVDMEDHTTTDATLRAVAALRADFPSTGAVLQASLHRSAEDCRELAAPGSRVRLCKGAYQEPAAVAWQQPGEVRSAFLRCLRTLALGRAHAMVATHDPHLITAAG
ncbi:MAG TPA: proline dehydrogenase family protein, partial [Candidatus Dormibacteraeota bacterium]|nr:proline dehydrogenase family protein [Candidatus Dormibacteraeota bacterium]